MVGRRAMEPKETNFWSQGSSSTVLILPKTNLVFYTALIHFLNEKAISKLVLGLPQPHSEPPQEGQLWYLGTTQTPR